MGRKRRSLPLIENIEITDVAAEGKAIAKLDNKVIFITQVVPGDIVDIQVTKKRKSFMEAIPVKFHKYSDIRVEAFCKHFGVCGGCKWQNLPYSEQLKYKHQQVIDNLERIKLSYPKSIIFYLRIKLNFTEINWNLRSQINAG